MKILRGFRPFFLRPLRVVGLRAVSVVVVEEVLVDVLEGAVAAGHVLVTPVSKYPEIREQLGRFPEARMGGDRLGLAVAAGNEPAHRRIRLAMS